MRRQHHKGKARPRSWHRGRGAGHLNESRLLAAEPVFAAAEQDRVDAAAASVVHRELVRDYEELLGGLARVSPFVPQFV